MYNSIMGIEDKKDKSDNSLMDKNKSTKEEIKEDKVTKWDAEDLSPLQPNEEKKK